MVLFLLYIVVLNPQNGAYGSVSTQLVSECLRFSISSNGEAVLNKKNFYYLFFFLGCFGAISVERCQNTRKRLLLWASGFVNAAETHL